MAEWPLLRVVLWLILLIFRFRNDRLIVLKGCFTDGLERFDCLAFSHHKVPRAGFPVHHHSGASYCLLLLLSGDISLNPGPIRFPCMVCSRSVKSNQKALVCDACQQWSHANCARVDDSLYRKLQAISDF